MGEVQLPENCSVCMIRELFCNIYDKLKEDHQRWSAFAKDCGKLDEMARILSAEAGDLVEPLVYV